MKRIINLKWFWLFFCGVVILWSCDDDVTIENNPNELTVDTFFESLIQIESSANGAYAQLQNIYQRNGYVLPDTFGDEMQSGSNPAFITSFIFQLQPTTDVVNNYWTACYKGIAVCNFIFSGEDRMLEKLPTGNFTQEDVDDALGQAHFLRGLYYYLLVKRYGGVPLVVDVDNVFDIPRSSEDQVYELIINDFKAATELLYTLEATEIGRANKGSALAMLGKVYLHREMYTEAQTTLSQISGYSLLPLEDYNDNFNESGEFNDESIFEVIYTGEQDGSQWALNGDGLGEVTWHAQEYTGWSNMRPSAKMIEEFEDEDPRLKSSILQEGDSYGPNNDFTRSGGGTVWYKFSQLYENEATDQNGDTNVRFLRYADVVLMQAEAEHKLGNDPGAIDFLNEIRARVEMPLYGTPEMDTAGYPVDTSSDVFRAIVHERMVELNGEQHRYDDLVRWNLDDQEITVDDDGQPRGYIIGVHRYMPIPQVEIDNNKNVNQSDQNPGY